MRALTRDDRFQATPPISTWMLAGGATYDPAKGVTIGTAPVVTPAFHITSGRTLRWQDGPGQTPGIRATIYWQTTNNTPISTTWIRSPSGLLQPGIPPSGAAQAVLQFEKTTGTGLLVNSWRITR